MNFVKDFSLGIEKFSLLKGFKVKILEETVFLMN